MRHFGVIVSMVLLAGLMQLDQIHTHATNKSFDYVMFELELRASAAHARMQTWLAVSAQDRSRSPYASIARRENIYRSSSISRSIRDQRISIATLDLHAVKLRAIAIDRDAYRARRPDSKSCTCIDHRVIDRNRSDSVAIKLH